MARAGALQLSPRHERPGRDLLGAGLRTAGVRGGNDMGRERMHARTAMPMELPRQQMDLPRQPFAGVRPADPRVPLQRRPIEQQPSWRTADEPPPLQVQHGRGPHPLLDMPLGRVGEPLMHGGMVGERRWRSRSPPMRGMGPDAVDYKRQRRD